VLHVSLTTSTVKLAVVPLPDPARPVRVHFFGLYNTDTASVTATFNWEWKDTTFPFKQVLIEANDLFFWDLPKTLPPEMWLSVSLAAAPATTQPTVFAEAD
jgi:hypothetical protein